MFESNKGSLVGGTGHYLNFPAEFGGSILDLVKAAGATLCGPRSVQWTGLRHVKSLKGCCEGACINLSGNHRADKGRPAVRRIKIGCVLLGLVSLAIGVSACGPQRDTADGAKKTSLTLSDQVANHAFWLGVGQTVAVELINRSTPAAASDPSILKLTDSFDSSSGKVTIFDAVRPGATVIEPGTRSCGLVACANYGPPPSNDEFYILVTDTKDKVTAVLTLADHGAMVALRQDERAVVGQSKYGCDFILCVGYEDVELVIAWWRAIVRARHETATAGTGLDHSGARSDCVEYRDLSA